MKFNRRSRVGRRGRNRKFARKTGFKKFGRRRNRQLYASREVVKYEGYRNLPYPPRFKTKFVSQLSGYILAGAGSNDGSAYVVDLNSLVVPWNNNVMTPNATTWPNPLATLNAFYPAGFSNMCNLSTGPYNMYKVVAAKIVVQLIPSVNESGQPVSLSCSLYPVIKTVGYSYPLVATTLEQAMTMPYAVTGMVNTYQRGSGIFKLYMPVHRLAGITIRTIADDPSGYYSAHAGSQPAYVGQFAFNWSTDGPSATGADVPYRVKVTYYTELYTEQGTQLSIGGSA